MRDIVLLCMRIAAEGEKVTFADRLDDFIRTCSTWAMRFLAICFFMMLLLLVVAMVVIGWSLLWNRWAS